MVDVANVVGSVPDGWWRDRVGAATRLLARLAPLADAVAEVEGPDGSPIAIGRIVAVVEGAAKAASAPDGVELVAAPADGDTTIAELAHELAEAIAAPVRFVQGTGDRVVPLAHAEFQAARVPRAELRAVEGAGHITVLDEIPRAMDRLLEWA